MRKSTIVIFALLIGASCFAKQPQLPSWLTNDKAKVWAVNQLVTWMKDAQFYKIQKIEVSSSEDAENKCGRMDVKLIFNDPKCANREVHLTALAPLCGTKGCYLYAFLTACKSDEMRSVEVLRN